MHPILHQYKLRLTNLSQGNRALKLGRLSTRRDLDITEASFINKLSAEEIVQRIVAGKSVNIIRELSANDESVNVLDRRLNRIYREVNTLYEETGTDDLFLGYPFVEGKFLDGSIARCPLLLFPVKLLRDFQRKPRWQLNVPKNEDVQFNKTFLLAYEKFQQVRFSKEFWDAQPEHENDLQDLLNVLYKTLKSHEVNIHFNTDLFQFKVQRFPDKNKDLLHQLETGVLRLLPHAVLGVFPQSDSALLQDYEVLEADSAAFDLDQFLRPQAEPPAEDYIKEEFRHYVAPVDQSQEHALLQVKNGRSVVVHGPPGTGKSQVILNLIADGLASGKRVLVCSQKRAALDVVYQRMSEIGLNRFAALVHDYRGDRNKIFQAIRRQIDDIESFQQDRRDLNRDAWMREFRQHSRRLDELNHSFEELYGSLRDTSRFGMSPHELYLAYVRDESQLMDVQDIADRLDSKSLNQLVQRFRELLDYLEFFAEDHPWRERISLKGAELQHRARILGKLDGTAEQLLALHSTWQNCLGASIPASEAHQLGQYLEAFREIAQLLEPEAARLDYSAFEGQKVEMAFARRKLESFGKIFAHMGNFELLDDFPLSLFSDLKMHFRNYAQFRGKFGRFFSLKWLKGRWYLQAILKRKGRKLKDGEMKLFRHEIDVLERLLKHFEDVEPFRFFSDLPLTDSPEKMVAWHVQKVNRVDMVSAIRAENKLPEPLLPGYRGVEFDAEAWENSKALVGSLQSFADLYEHLQHGWDHWLSRVQSRAFLQATTDPEAAETALKALKSSFERDFDELRALDDFVASFTPAEGRLLRETVSADMAKLPEDGKEAYLQRLELNIVMRWVELLEAQHPELLLTTSRRMHHMREEYQELVRKRQEMAVELILRKLKLSIVDAITYNRLKNPVTYRDIAHQVNKKRGLWSVRKLVRSFWEEGLARLMPCWMASPESVAAIFPMESGFFDLVIFDEASQCYVERAVPVILRGKQCIIAGDDKQLPPFDMYNVKVDESDSPFFEEEMALEVESVLDLAKNVFTEVKLNWHYRSEEEELINFSNFAFYDGRLNIVPPARHLPEYPVPLEFVRVEGRWERNTNMAEAQHVIALVEALVESPESPSIGVVTFNYHQKELIRDLLEQRIEALAQSGQEDQLRRLNNAMEREEGEERQGLFVKNIENVQGDERDVIVFSIGYARNEKGKLITNFGLLNQKGGENRLNVAITRARKKIIVLCSFEPSELQVAESRHAGPKLFKKYLQYAQALTANQKGYAMEILQSLDSSDRGMAGGVAVEGVGKLKEMLALALEQAGYEVKMDIGDTNYKLDLGISGTNGEFLLGIECEGPNYFSGKSAKEREVYRLNLLQRRGWEMMRIWSRAHYLNPEAVVRQVIARLGQAE